MCIEKLFKRSFSNFKLAALFGLRLLGLLLNSFSLFSPEDHVLLHIESSSALCINVVVVDAELFLSVRLECNHLLKGHCVRLSAAVQPQIENNFLVATLRIAHLIVVEFKAHKLLRSNKLKLVAKVRNRRWVHLRDHLKESGTIAFSFVERLLTQGDCCDIDIRGLHELLEIGRSLEGIHCTVDGRLSRSKIVTEICLDQIN